ncbi:MAG: RNA polymerase factor sigma-54 [Fusobacterium sp. JB019]|nr:RNA polymerase factor sigma-54 [Fusobacterium sp. JB020]MDP0507565.1 RNA polymerase factor sigma-54 [Fusobacterium sp. JB019]
MDFSLNIKQELKLILTQSMKISLNILEMSSFDLEKYILKESKKNPFVEVQYTNNYRKTKNSDGASPLDFAHKEKNLIDFLEEQIGYIHLNNNQRFLYTFIVNNLDNRGYLGLNIKEIKSLTKFSTKEIKEALKNIKKFEPIGIGASNLEECLIIQLHKKNITDLKLEYIIKNLLKEIALGRLEEIGEKVELSIQEVEEKLKIIRTLNPIPSRGFYMGDTIRYIIPEAEVKKIEGKYAIIMNEDSVPKVKINKSLKLEKESSNDYFNSANNLIKCIKKRRETLKEILEIILEKQYDYFSEGKTKKFLPMKLVAKQLKIHESTVSRAIKNKYIKTEKGVERIRDFFVLDEQKEKVDSIIEKIILKEDREKPVSDQEITKILNEMGIKIARRTVAKYRENLGIKSTSKRKVKRI